MKPADHEYRIQPSLFDDAPIDVAVAVDRPLSRQSDPETSKISEPHAENVRYLRGLFLHEVCESKEPLTANEIGAKAAHRNPDVCAESVRKRLAELVAAGLVKESGQRHRCTVGKGIARTFIRTRNEVER